jgi:hypothetical protein
VWLQAFSCGGDPFKALGGSWLKKSSQEVSAGETAAAGRTGKHAVLHRRTRNAAAGALSSPSALSFTRSSVFFALSGGRLSPALTLAAAAVQVTDAERAMVKQITYGLCYGMGSGKMAAALGIPELQAREMADDFKGSHPALTDWMQVCVIVGACLCVHLLRCVLRGGVVCY